MSFVIKNTFLQSKLEFLLRVFQLILFTKITSSLFAPHIHLIILISAVEKLLELITGQKKKKIKKGKYKRRYPATGIYNKKSVKLKRYLRRTLRSYFKVKQLSSRYTIYLRHHTTFTSNVFSYFLQRNI